MDRMALMVQRLQRVWKPTIHLPFIALALYAIWLVLVSPSKAQELIGTFGVVAARAAAAFTLLAVSRSRRSQRLWSYLGVGATLWAAASAIDLVIRLMSGQPPALPSPPDLVYLAGYLAALTGVAAYRRPDPERFGRVREILDVAILALAVSALAWIVLLRPALAVGFGDPIPLIWAAFAPILASILVVLLARLAMRTTSGNNLRNFLLLAFAGAMLAIADLADAYSRLQDEFVTSGFVAVVWVASALTVMSVGLRLLSSNDKASGEPSPVLKASSRIEPLLPLALTYVVVGTAILGWWLTRQVDWLTVAAAASLSLLLVARQGVIIGQRELKQYALELETALDEVADAREQLERLNLRLEQKVGTRTAELEKTVADLERLNEELKELDQLKSEFVALVTHELRAPLTNIRTGIELILDRNPEIESDRLHVVQEEIKRLGALVEAILDISALEAGRFPLHLQSVELDQIALDVISQMPELERIQTEFPAELPPLMADERGLKSVLYHVLDNATKYAPKGDLVLHAEEESGFVRVSLSDSGPGIPVEERERVFEMFHRLDSSDAREVYGHGLGLPMARKLVEAMGGGIRAEPNENAGARIVFWLPEAGAD
jgi:signal transduction histidine kinase